MSAGPVDSDMKNTGMDSTQGCDAYSFAFMNNSAADLYLRGTASSSLPKRTRDYKMVYSVVWNYHSN